MSEKIIVIKCPACHAPLPHLPPCICEYCQTKIDYEIITIDGLAKAVADKIIEDNMRRSANRIYIGR